jgi:hypothetical protein
MKALFDLMPNRLHVMRTCVDLFRLQGKHTEANQINALRVLIIDHGFAEISDGEYVYQLLALTKYKSFEPCCGAHLIDKHWYYSDGLCNYPDVTSVLNTLYHGPLDLFEEI